jgi:hypothetical protein
MSISSSTVFMTVKAADVHAHVKRLVSVVRMVTAGGVYFCRAAFFFVGGRT